MTRWVDLEGVVNMRDLGGLPTADGRTTQPRRLLRSDNLQDLSEPDIRHLVDELGVSDIIDLRSEMELNTEGPGPLRQLESLRHHHHSLFGEQGKPVTAEDALVLTSPEPTVRDAAFWAGHYLTYVRNRPDSISAALDVIGAGNGAVIVHCAAGKDRTGTVVALALDVAGVPHEEIVADYALSAERIDRIMARLIARELYAPALRDQQPGDQTSHPESMRIILQTLADEFGGTAQWLQAQGWSSDRIARLRDRLTLP